MENLQDSTINHHSNNKIEVNRYSLNFKVRKLEKKFRDLYFDKSLKLFRLSFVTAILLYAAFGYIDYFYSFDYFTLFFKIRFVYVLPFLVSVFVYSFFPSFKKTWQLLISLCFIIAGSGIIFMLLSNPDNIYYYGGMFLIFIAGFFFIKLRFIWASSTGIALIILYKLYIRN